MFIVKDQNETKKTQADIRIIGVGGGGNNALETMIKTGIDGVQFIAVNTDHQTLETSCANQKIQIGSKLTKGLGAGANPEIGRRSAVESYEEIMNCLKGADMVFITAGMGGGTGTGGAPLIAEISNELGILTVGIVTKPFLFEGRKRMSQAKKGIEELSQYTDTLITIPNEKLLNLVSKDTSLLEAFKLTDEVLLQAVKSISDLVNVPGLINLDFSDIKTVMKNKGVALMGRGSSSGSDRAEKALKKAISSPLLDGFAIEGATGIIVNVSSDSSLSLLEFQKASSFITERADPSADVIVGTVIDENMKGELSVTVIATGFTQNKEENFTIKNTKASTSLKEEKINNFLENKETSEKTEELNEEDKEETSQKTKPSNLEQSNSFLKSNTAQETKESNQENHFIEEKSEEKIHEPDFKSHNLVNSSSKNDKFKKMSLKEILLLKSKEYEKSQANKKAQCDKQIDMKLQESHENFSSPFEASVEINDNDI
ncbi:MAG: cell division protein FtsZ [Bdellovibrionales bacterium]|nr:cell division protein FtsZ [Bdellovibrionales bacterium]